jgi:hypothetical protein
MHIKNGITIVFSFALVTALACTEAKSPRSEAIERAKVVEPTLTSTAPAKATEPLPEKRFEQTIPNIAEPVPVEDRGAFEPELGASAGLSIQRLVTATGVDKREPVAPSALFGQHDTRIYAFVEVSNESHEDETLTVHFIGPDGQVSGGIELHIPAEAPRWRTWAFTEHAKEPGLWRVEIRSSEGALVGALPFEVEPDC